jgi:actin-related protein
VTAENAGIATKYTEWPGKTRMLIPLSAGAQKGSVTAVPAGQLAAPEVIENLQEQPGKALPERKELTELQQRGIEENQQKAEEQQRQLELDRQKLAEEQRKLDEMKQAGAGAEAVRKQEQAVAAQEQKVQKDEQAASQSQAQVAADQKSVQEQRATIAADEQAVIKQQAAQPGAQTTAAGTGTAAPGQLLFIYAVAASPDKLGKLVLIDRTSGKLLSQSDLNTVRGRMYVTLGSSLVVVAGATGGNAAVRLVSLDPATLAVQKQGKDNLAPTSYLAASSDSVYAVLNTAKGAFLGRFDGSLALQAQSAAAVDASTYILLSGAEVFVQDTAGNILILNKDDLKEKKRNG